MTRRRLYLAPFEDARARRRRLLSGALAASAITLMGAPWLAGVALVITTLVVLLNPRGAARAIPVLHGFAQSASTRSHSRRWVPLPRLRLES